MSMTKLLGRATSEQALEALGAVFDTPRLDAPDGRLASIRSDLPDSDLRSVVIFGFLYFEIGRLQSYCVPASDIMLFTRFRVHRVHVE
jgi:hypothetical protein